MVRSGYVLAGFETLATIMDLFMTGRRGRFNDNFTRAEVSNFLSSTCSGFLHSYGQNFANKKKYDKYNQTEANMFNKCRDMQIFDNCNFIVDSGGFQISTGRLTRKESDLLHIMYYDFIEEHHEVFDKAFILDIPPGPGCEIFKNFCDVYKLNLDSYTRAKELPDHIRKKLIYVHHFRTPKLWEIYTRILRDYDMFSSFEYHSTGGIVANMSSDMTIPCIIYVLPLIPLINEAMRNKRTYLNFHILGGANFRDVLYYELFKITVKKKHNFDLNITYDSSGPYKQVMHARFLHAKDEYNRIRKMSIKENDLNYRFMWDRTTIDNYQHLMNKMADKWKFKRIDIDGVYGMYENKSGIMTSTFHADVKAYSILYALNIYSEIHEEMRIFAEKVYPIYEAGLMEEFYHECFKITRTINQGNQTKKQKIKSHSIPKSLDMLGDLDEDYCKHLITKYLAKDEFIELDDTKRILTF
jgi:hypothetical protein